MALSTANLDSDSDLLSAARVDLRDTVQRVIDLTVSTGAGTGTELLPYKGRTVAERLEEKISIANFGGADDYVNTPTGVTDNYLALAAAIVAYPAKRIRLHFPKLNTGKYYFAYLNYGDLDNFEISTDPGVSFYLPNNVAYANPKVKYVNDVPMVFLDQNTKYTGKAAVGYSENFSEEKTDYLGLMDHDNTTVTSLPATADTAKFVNLTWPDGPIATSTASTIIDAQRIDINSPGGSVELVQYRIEPGQELSFWLDVPPAYAGTLFAGVTTHGGHELYYESAINASAGGALLVKDGASAFVNTGVPPLVSGSNDHYWMRNSYCTLRVITPTCFSFAVNGKQRILVRQTKSPIETVSIGAGFATGVVAVRDTCVINSKTTTAQRPIGILTAGDSITDKLVHGNWPQYMCRALSGWMGLQIRKLENIAVSGANTQSEYDLLLVTPLAGIDAACILLGTNDIQGGVLPANYLTFIGGMIDHLNANNIPVVVGVPLSFYSRALAAGVTGFAGQGQNTLNYKAGAPYRGGLFYKLAAAGSMNKLLLLPEYVGASSAEWLSSSEKVDPVMFDNIHPTSETRRDMGLAFARAVGGLLSPRATREQPLTIFKSSWILNSWTGNANSGYSVSHDGVVSFRGFITRNAGVINALTKVMQLPRNIWPKQDIFTVALQAQTLSGVRNLPIPILINTAGEVILQDTPASTLFIDLTPISYKP